MQRHRKTFRAFNGQECWNEPLTLHPPDGYEGKHCRPVFIKDIHLGMVYWSASRSSFRRLTEHGAKWI